MGQLRFKVPSRDRLPAGALDRAYLCGIEGIPWRAQTRWVANGADGQRGVFVVDRPVDESGNLFVPWRAPDGSEIVLSTASLMERHDAYHLTVELARGLVNQLRNQSSDWRLLGMQIPDSVANQLQAATRCFADAVTATEDAEISACAERSIELGVEAAELLMNEYSRQALAVRHQQCPQLPTMLGASIDSEPIDERLAEVLLPAINTASVEMLWGEIEQVAGKPEWGAYDQQVDWCGAQGLRIIGGPLLQLTARSVPDWLYLWEKDFDQLQSYVSHQVSATVSRYKGRVQIWNCAAGLNVRSKVNLTEEQKLRLVVTAIDEVRRCDPNVPMIISFDQPWGEYLAFEEVDLSPIHFADSLIRAELGVAGIGLEVNLGYWPGGTLPRNRLEVSRMLDRWSVLNLPLIVFLTAPSGPAEGLGDREPLVPEGAEPTQQRQQFLAEQLLPVLMSKSFVQGIVWNQLTDAGRVEYPCGGLFDASLQPKPVVETLAELRREHLT